MAALCVVLLGLPLVFDHPAAIPVLSQIGIAVIFALSYNMVLGQSGLLSFAHAIFFGFGGFAAVHVLRAAGAGSFPLPVPFVPLAGGMGGLAIAALLGSFATKRVGMAFAMITLCLVELVIASASVLGRFYGGGADRTAAPRFFGIDFTSDVAVYYLIACWMAVSIAAMAWYAGSPLGRMTLAARDSELRAEYLGYNARVIRFSAFTAGGFFAGIAGGLFAVAYEFVGGEVITFATSRDVIIMAYIGGVGHFAGPIIGAVVLTLLQSLLSNYTEIWGLYVGIVFVGAVMFAPGGIAGVIAQHLPFADGGGLRRLILPYASFAACVVIAAIGLIGILETISFLNEAAVGEHRYKLFGLDTDARSGLTWTLFLILTAGGSLLGRKALRSCRTTWQSLISERPAP